MRFQCKMSLGGEDILRHTSRIFVLCIMLALLAPGVASATKIVLDPGHGGHDSGALGVNGLQEKVVNLDISLKVRELLEQRGIEVAMTREDDRFLSLAERIEFAKRQDPDILVSVHANWFQNPATQGALMLYYDKAYPQESYPASSEMIALSPISKLFAQTVQDTYAKTTGIQSRGLMESSVYMVRMGNVPSILIETAFLSNVQDEALLADEQQRSRMALGIADGITNYLTIVFPDTIGHWAREAILRMNAKGWLQGYRNFYNPEVPITRAEFVSLLDRVFSFEKLQPFGLAPKVPSKPVDEGQTPTSNNDGVQATEPKASTPPKPGNPPAFSDLEATHWAYKQLIRASELGLLKGYPDGTVRPEAPITRGETAYLLHLVLEQVSLNGSASGGAVKAPFTDVPKQLWSANAIYALREQGLITGFTATEYKPDRSMTRAEMSIVLDRYASKSGK